MHRKGEERKGKERSLERLHTVKFTGVCELINSSTCRVLVSFLLAVRSCTFSLFLFLLFIARKAQKPHPPY